MDKITVGKSLSLRDAGQFDVNNGIKDKLTGWGKICKLRAEGGQSRSARIRRGVGKSGKRAA